MTMETCEPVWDHPRMCGEHLMLLTISALTVGSSPHVRGAPDITGDGGTNRGIIPACAGSTVGKWRNYCLIRDHPRMCGEHDVKLASL